jgi:hypothetical protein
MPLFADDFMAGALLSLLLPVCVLIAIAAWYVLYAKRTPDAHPSSPTLPPPEVVAAVADADIEAIEPAGPPPGEIR